MFQRLGYRHQKYKNSFEGDVLPQRRHNIDQESSLGERQVAEVNIREGVTTLKIRMMN